MGVYDGILRDVILRMKHWSGEGLAEMLGRLFAQELVDRWSAFRPEYVIPVPLHWKRRFRRGYNQSQILAEEVARHAHIPCQSNWVRRVRNTPRQAGQDLVARRKNVEGAFAATGELPIHGRSVMLIDDVMTTGATLHEAARVLRPFRPRCISVAVLARPS